MKTILSVILISLVICGCGPESDSVTYAEAVNLVSGGAVLAKRLQNDAVVTVDRSGWTYFSTENNQDDFLTQEVSVNELMRSPAVDQSLAFMTFVSGLEPRNEDRCIRSNALRRGSGVPQITAPSLIEFNQVEIRGPVTVIAEYNPTPAVVIFADNNLISLIETESRNNVLTISVPSRDICYGVQPRIYVRGPQFDTISLREQSNLEVYGLYSRSVDIDAGNGSRIEVRGQSNRVHLRMAPHSSAELGALTVDNLDIDLAEHSDAEVVVTKSVIGSMNQDSRIRLNSTVQSEEITGDGVIEYLDMSSDDPPPNGLEPGIN